MLRSSVDPSCPAQICTTLVRPSPSTVNADAASTTDNDNDSFSFNFNGNDYNNTDTHHLPTTEPRPERTTTTLETQARPSRLKTYLTAQISTNSNSTSMSLLLIALSTGINDAATFLDYHLFVSNQTGNTVFIGIGTFDRNSIFDLRHVGLSLGGFLAGGLASGQLSLRVTGKRRRWWVIASNASQTILTFTAAALRQWYATSEGQSTGRSDPSSFSVVALLAFASGMQVAMAKGLGVAEIPTGMITSAWIDLVVDPKLWVFWRRNRARDRRAAFVLCILVGGFIGAAAHVYWAVAGPLLLAAVIKSAATVGFLLGVGEAEEEEEGGEKEKIVQRMRNGNGREIAKV